MFDEEVTPPPPAKPPLVLPPLGGSDGRLESLEPPPPFPELSEVSRELSNDIGRWNMGSGAITTSGSCRE